MSVEVYDDRSHVRNAEHTSPHLGRGDSLLCQHDCSSRPYLAVSQTVKQSTAVITRCMASSPLEYGRQMQCYQHSQQLHLAR
eukprot:scaffold682116_cov29-Prasinocladus_malaysianus.AAC.1